MAGDIYNLVLLLVRKTIMIEDENHPEMGKAHKELLGRLGLVLERGNKTLDKYLVRKMFDVVDQHRKECKGRGIDFPPLVALIVPRLGIIEFKRADLDLPAIRTSIVNFVRFNPAARMEEVVNAFKGAYPDLNPDDILQPADVGQRAHAAKNPEPEPE